MGQFSCIMMDVCHCEFCKFYRIHFLFEALVMM